MSRSAIRAAILDLDGVVTRTATQHARAWKEMFDDFLEHRQAGGGGDEATFEPFDIARDYPGYVDGKPRLDGVRSFLDSRGIRLPEGEPDDPPEADTIRGLGARKNGIFLGLLEREEVQTFEDAVEQIARWREEGVATALITSSRNGRRILRAAGITDLFDVTIDGEDAERLGIAGKPAPDIFLHAARELRVEPREAVVFEDAISGVEAGRAGNFGLVVGVARNGGDALREAGADLVVRDLREVSDLRAARDAHSRQEPHDRPGTQDPPEALDPPEPRNPPDLGDAAKEGGRPESRQRHEGRSMLDWELVYTRWDPAEQPLREALCALGNGVVVTRGAFEESRSGGPHCPGTYLAGGYNRLETEIAGRVVENEDLVNWPNWLPLTFRADGGDWFSLDSVEVLDFEQRLNVLCGILSRSVRFRDAQGREFLLESRRIVHVASPQLAAIEWTLTPLDWSGEIEIRSALDGDVANRNVRRYQALNNRHLEVVRTGHDAEDSVFLTAETSQSRIRMCQAARTRVFDGDAPAPTRRVLDGEPGRIGQRIFVPCRQQKPLRVEKVVAVRTTRDFATSEPEDGARKALRRAGSFVELLASHETRWKQLWSISDIRLVNGDQELQLILRLHIFHLLQSVSPNTIDRDVGVPARGWHGEAYRGHIFWDELFIFPFISLRFPELARSLLMYRYRRLDEARHLARCCGYAGAMFPWQSGSDGREETQQLHLNPESGRWLPDESHIQRHVNAAIAYNVWRYHEATGDMEFLSSYGAEMLVELARFWSSLAVYRFEHDRYEIRGVMGPDEFHTRYPDSDEPGLNNNAYTNVMAAWVLRCACGVLELLDEERRSALKEELAVADEELVRWDEVSRKLFVPFHGDGIISQFEGYEKLEEFDWEGYRSRYGNIQRLDRILEAEGDDVNRYQASKQADVLMLFYLLSADELGELFGHMGHRFDPWCIPRNIDYYLRRTSHGSTLSRIVHYWVMARGDREQDWSLFEQALRSDIDDIQGGTTHEGIHLGAMAGTVDLIQRCHTGLEMRGGVLWFNPVLPRELSDVRLRLHYQGHWLSLLLTDGKFTVSFDRGSSPAARIGFRDEVHEMKQGETREFTLDSEPRPRAGSPGPAR
jgi:beta-phosphoglucomutase family hydrolase